MILDATEYRNHEHVVFRVKDTDMPISGDFRHKMSFSAPPQTVAQVRLVVDWGVIPPRAGIYSVCTHADYLRHGYAERLLRRAIRSAKRRHITYLHLEIMGGRANTAALRLYEKCGFVFAYPAATDDWHAAQMRLQLREEPGDA